MFGCQPTLWYQIQWGDYRLYCSTMLLANKCTYFNDNYSFRETRVPLWDWRSACATCSRETEMVESFQVSWEYAFVISRVCHLWSDGCNSCHKASAKLAEVPRKEHKSPAPSLFWSWLFWWLMAPIWKVSQKQMCLTVAGKPSLFITLQCAAPYWFSDTSVYWTMLWSTVWKAACAGVLMDGVWALSVSAYGQQQT